MKYWSLRTLVVVPMIVAALLGLGFGSAFLWATPRRAWEWFTAGMLWMLMVSSGGSLLYCLRTRVPRGDWQQGVRIGASAFFPATTVFLLMVALMAAGAPIDPATPLAPRRPNLVQVLPIAYGLSLLMAAITGPAYALTSPFHPRPPQDRA